MAAASPERRGGAGRARGLARLAAYGLAGLAVAGVVLVSREARRVAPVPTAPRLVVLYATCSLNKERLSPYRPELAFTPALERFGREALVFERHQTEAGQSGTAFASLFTGSQASVHGILRHPAFLDPDLYTITEAFADAGYEVHTWLEHLMATSALGYGQGTAESNAHGGRLEAGDPTLERILDRLEHDPAYRAFLVTSFTVTHFPYAARELEAFCARYPQECAARADAESFERRRRIVLDHFLPLAMDREATFARLGLGRDEVEALAAAIELLYRAGVFELDRLFGALVEAIDSRGLAPESLVAFTSDHGEVLYRENAPLSWTHGFQLAPEELEVALLLRGPGVGIRPGRFPAVTRSIDVFPTLARLAGIERPLPGTQGVDLSSAVRGEVEPPELLAFSHSALYPGPIRELGRLSAILGANRPEDLQVAVRRRDLLFRLQRGSGGDWQPTLVDLTSDPSHVRDLFDRADESHREMLDRLRRYKRDLVAGHSRVQARRLARAKEQELLKQLGYLQ
jgi:arylsulfatase A-like enzyme